ncbi:hypothetical protein GCM10010259_00680 [Streptomyces daghestanicus]|uniref:SAM-dependent methyltransferase n=3 Tax=Streptomyces TaxID=1883 RepID=A0ABT9LQD0_STRGD|nr:hypothetical protein [Streptomyces griseoviridis]GGS77047.1 hypothetical protein GCM10010240_07480 [Streptomyces griseoviridis]GGU14424.1 hypothetical protein GCM10010259_00680 [Streptomyces daghestanicus]GHI35050.1 hypothetical protein Sdagh_67800 [Streptomyces daghestanicus]
MTVCRFLTDEAWPEPVCACTGACLEKWPVVVPVEANDTRGAEKKGLMSFTGPDGAARQTIDCWPIRTFAGDKAPGDPHGQGVGGTWYAVGPDGKPVRKQRRRTGPPPPLARGGGGPSCARCAWHVPPGRDRERMVNFRFRSLLWRAISSLCSNTGSPSALESQMERPAWAPRSIDITVPSVSRIHDFYLGGSHNFEVDREAARRAMRSVPGLPKIMQAGRAFMRRAVRHAAGAGITQFLDIGSGIPAFGSVHEVVRRVRPDARVVYVDHDPVAVAHSQAVLDGDEHVDIVAADLLTPRDILASEQVERLIDLNRPVALLLVAILHFVEDRDDPYTAVAELTSALAPGSMLVLSHAAYEGMPLPPERAKGAVEVYKDIRKPLIMRTREEIARFFEGYDMVEPGLVPMACWRPESAPEDEDPYAFSGFAGVGRTA